jgi:hypothetical protein
MMQNLHTFSSIISLIYSFNPSVSKVKARKLYHFKIFPIITFIIVAGYLTSDIYSQIRQADYYIDGINGNDSNNGTTPQTAWKTIDKLNSSLSSGNTYAIRDSIYYYRNSGSAGLDVSVSNIRITNWWPNASWRNGDKLPIIACSYKISNWTNVSGNIWQATGSGSNSLVFTYPDSIKWGMARSSQSSLTKECDFYKSGSTYYVYSPSDPDTRYESVDANRLADGINNKGDNNMFDHLDVRYSTSNGMMFEPDGQYSTFRDSRIQYTGSSQGVLSGTGSEGVYLHATGSKCINNYIREHTHHSVFVYNTGTPFSDITIDSNLVTNGHYNFFDMNGGTISGIKIRYNVAYEEDWAEYRQEPNYTGRNGGFWTNGGVQDVLIAYNLVYNMYEAVLFDARVGQITAHNNTFVQTRSGGDGGMVVYSDGGSGSDWKNNILACNGGSVGSVSGSNNISTTSLSSVGWQNWQQGNFHLTSGSSAINYGVNLGYTKDLDGNPIVGLPDAGAYEFSSGGGGNNPPNQPSNPSPSNGAANQPINLNLSWTCSDPNGDPLTYDVYFGTNSNPPVVSTNQSATSFNPGQLTNSTTYYWKIVAKDNQGAFTTGAVWNFSTESAGGGNNPPNQPANPNPASGSTNQPINLNLSWSCSDPDGDPLTYDVYFGTNSNPPLAVSNQSATSFNPGQLTNSTTYYWKIVAEDNQGASTSGPVWNFTTESAGGDLTPPELIGIQIVEPDELVLDFSEPIDPEQVNNLQNYTISNNISVTGATLSETQQRICLTTSNHDSNYVYSVELDNLTDTAGNSISTSGNFSFYKLLDIGQITYYKYLMESVEASATTDTNTSPQKTLDGLVNGDPDPYSRWAAEIMPQWIQYDLGEVKEISLIASSFYRWNMGRIYHYSIHISNDGTQWNTIVNNQTSSSQEWTLNELPILTYARYVRVTCLSNSEGNWAGLWEARIFGPSQIPVEFVSFTAIVNDENKVELDWTTASELNNQRFDVERKSENEEYRIVGSIPGKGTSLELNEYNFTDNSVEPSLYVYRLKQVDFNGEFSYSDEVEVLVNKPLSFKLEQNYPNPFNPTTTINFTLPKKQIFSLKVYNTLGELINNLIEEERDAGHYSVKFDASDLPSGIYFYSISIDQYSETKKMILSK